MSRAYEDEVEETAEEWEEVHRSYAVVAGVESRVHVAAQEQYI